MPLPIKHPQTRQTESRKGKQLLNERPHDCLANGEQRAVRVYHDIVNLREAHHWGYDRDDADAKDEGEGVQVFAREAVAWPEGADCEEGDEQDWRLLVSMLIDTGFCSSADGWDLLKMSLEMFVPCCATIPGTVCTEMHWSDPVDLRFYFLLALHLFYKCVLKMLDQISKHTNFVT